MRSLPRIRMQMLLHHSEALPPVERPLELQRCLCDRIAVHQQPPSQFLSLLLQLVCDQDLYRLQRSSHHLLDMRRERHEDVHQLLGVVAELPVPRQHSIRPAHGVHLLTQLRRLVEGEASDPEVQRPLNLLLLSATRGERQQGPESLRNQPHSLREHGRPSSHLTLALLHTAQAIALLCSEGFSSTSLMQLPSMCSCVHLMSRQSPVAKPMSGDARVYKITDNTRHEQPITRSLHTETPAGARQAFASSSSPNAWLEVVALAPRVLAGLASKSNPFHRDD
eukprot:21130-Hanusia_phi.AAC.9